jgi:RNA polymerase sigma-70 factor (ECF subfamily)
LPSKHNDYFKVAEYLNSGNPEILRQLFECSLPQLRSVIFKLIFNDSLTDDLVHDTFVKVMEKLNLFNGDSSFATWVCRIGINHTISFMRAKKNNSVGFQEEHVSGISNNQEVEENDTISLIHREIQNLPVELRAALVLSINEDYSIDQIAQELKCKKSTVYWKINKAREMLEIKLGQLL